MGSQYKELEDRLQKARITLLRNHFFLGSFLVNLPTFIDPQVETAETNGEWIKYNPAFIKPLSDDQILFLYAHEVLHVVLEHTLRLGNRNPEIWGVACDVVVNFLLCKDKIGVPIKGGIYEPKLYEQGRGQVERIYDLMVKDLPPLPINVDKLLVGKSFDKISPQTGTPEEILSKSQKLKEKIAAALNVTKLCGNTPKGIERFIEKSLYTAPSCLEVLHEYMVKLSSTTRTYSRPSRRFITRGMYLPSIPREMHSGHIAVCCDTSGSISKTNLAYFKGMLEMCRDIYKPELMTISYFDYVVHSSKTFYPEDEIIIPVKGGGGTSYHALWDMYPEPPDVCLVFSDMQCKSFGKRPDYPVIWLSTGILPKVPFGKVINFFAR